MQHASRYGAYHAGGGKNLISVGQLTADGYEVIFRKSRCEIVDANGKTYATASRDMKGMYVYDIMIGGTKIKQEREEGSSLEEEAQAGELMHSDPVAEEVMTTDDKKRATELRGFHKTLGHPSDSVLSSAISAGVYSEKLFTARDVVNAQRLILDTRGTSI